MGGSACGMASDTRVRGGYAVLALINGVLQRFQRDKESNCRISLDKWSFAEVPT